jgi:hypothetical protein
MATPTPMSLFGTVSSITSTDKLIVLTNNGNNTWTNATISVSDGAKSLGRNRWLPTPPSNSSDPIGQNGDEAFRNNGSTLDYYVKNNGVWFKTTFSLF